MSSLAYHLFPKSEDEYSKTSDRFYLRLISESAEDVILFLTKKGNKLANYHSRLGPLDGIIYILGALLGTALEGGVVKKDNFMSFFRDD